jgi:hypothetical protein
VLLLVEEFWIIGVIDDDQQLSLHRLSITLLRDAVLSNIEDEEDCSIIIKLVSNKRPHLRFGKQQLTNPKLIQ